MDEMKETRRVMWICLGAFAAFTGLLVISFLKLEWLQFIIFCGAFLSLIFAGIGVVELIEHRFRYWRW